MIDKFERIMTRYVKFWLGVGIVQARRRVEWPLENTTGKIFPRIIYDICSYLPSWFINLTLHRRVVNLSYYRPGHPKHPPRPAEQLQGMQILGKNGTIWTVGERIEEKSNADLC